MSSILRNKYVIAFALILLLVLLLLNPLIALALLVAFGVALLVMRRMRGKAVRKLHVRVVKRYEDVDVIDVRSCLITYGIGRTVVKINDNLLAGLSVELMDSEVMREISRISSCIIVRARDESYVIVKDRSYEGLLDSLNSLITYFQVKSLRFRVLRPDELIEVVFKTCGLM